MWDFMKWYHLVLFILFILMVFSPVWFFRKLDQLLNGESMTEAALSFQHIPHPSSIVKEDFSLDRDMHVLNNLNRMIENAPASAQYLWTVKKAEFEREIRWKNLVNFNSGHAHEKVSTTS